MERSALLKLMVSICLLSACNGRETKIQTWDNTANFNHTMAPILAQYASAVYTADLRGLIFWTCARCNNFTLGFQMIELIVDIQNCLQAFVGVASDPNAIIVAIRGSQGDSIQNWIEDLIWQELDLKLPNMPGAMVHRGLYGAYNNTILRPSIVQVVKRIRESHGEPPVMVTGHSMGGALAAFSALDLAINHGIENVHLMTFGQPRIGNAAFASCLYEYIPNTFRIVHDRDIVPHLPPRYSFYWKSFHHFPVEVWLQGDSEKVCDDSGEDPLCSRSVQTCSVNDHMTYYGLDMEAEEGRSCRVNMDRSLPYQTDGAGREQVFDFFKLAEQWPGSLHLLPKKKPVCSPKYKIDNNKFGIHGLWPANATGTQPEFCPSNTRFDKENLKPGGLLGQLEEKWPSYMCPSSDSSNFWETEWKKHGTCSTLSQFHYFGQARILHVNYNPSQCLKNRGIEPSDSTVHLLSKIEEAFQNCNRYDGHIPIIKCLEDTKTKLYYLWELELCIEKS